jgi:hypothetical protein
MVIMVQGGETWNPPLETVYRCMIEDGVKFTGSRSFTWWVNAVAYALLPAVPHIAQTGRRLVVRGSSGRWIVSQTFSPRVMPGDRDPMREVNYHARLSALGRR